MAVYGNYCINENIDYLFLEFSLSDSLKNMKDKLINIFTNLIDKIQKLINKIPDDKVKTEAVSLSNLKSSLTSILQKAKNGLQKAKNVNDASEAEKLYKEANDIKDDIQKWQEQYKSNVQLFKQALATSSI